jgi:HTH-type transcriptional regulator, sugar sensing transcriptional regulator
MDVENYKELEDLGLNSSEIKVYVTLLELNESKTGRLCSFTGITSSRIYSVLEGLIDKGLVSYKLENKVKVYMPAPPEILENILIEKQKNILKTVKSLKEKTSPSSKFKYKLFNNLRGIKSMFYEINNIMNKNMILNIYSSKKGSFERLIGLFDEHHKIRIEKRVFENVLLSVDKKELGVKRKNKYTDVRYNVLENTAEWGVIGEEMLYIFYIKGDDPKGILIEDSVIAKTFKEVFEKVWNVSK